METIKIDKKNALKAYHESNGELRKVLGTLLGEEVISQKVTDRIKTFADVLEDLGEDPKLFYKTGAGLPEDEAAYRRLKLITRALNERELTTDETWYYPVFNREAGFGFALTYDDGWTSGTGVGERLSFHSPELAEYAGRTFTADYKAYLIKPENEKTN